MPDLEIKEYKGLRYFQIEKNTKTDKNTGKSLNTYFYINSPNWNDGDAQDFVKKYRAGQYVYHHFRKIETMSFQPFDTSDFDNTDVYFSMPSMRENLIKWIGSILKFPDEVDISFEISNGQNVLYAIARTEKNGKITYIKKKIDGSVPMEEAFNNLLPYFIKNCKKPNETSEIDVCSNTLVELMKTATDVAVRRFEEWYQKVRNRTRGTYIQELYIPGNLFTHDLVEKLIINFNGKNLIKSTIVLKGGHMIIEDDIGCDIIIRKTHIPDTILSCLKGKTVDQLIDVEWLRNLKIKSIKPNPEAGTRGFRASYDVVPCKIESDHIMTPDVAYEIIDRKICWGTEKMPDTWDEAEEAVTQLFLKLSPQQLAEVLTSLDATGTIYMEKYGFPDWSISGSGNNIKLDRSKNIKVSDIINMHRERWA